MMSSDKPSSDKPASAPTSSDKNQLFSNTVRDIFNTHNRTTGSVKGGGRGLNSKDQSELALALTVILVEIASSDQNFEMREYTSIQEGLKSIFGTSKSDSQVLINQATTILANLRGSSRYAELLRESLSEPERLSILRIVDDLINADGRQDGFELYLRQRLTKALGLNPNAGEGNL